MAISPIGKKVGEGEVKLPMDNPAVVEALKHGTIQDVHKLLSDYGISGITAADFEQFAAAQHGKYVSSIIQPDPLYEGEAAIPPPEYEKFAEFDMTCSLSQDDGKAATEMFVKAASSSGSGGKAASSGKGAGKGLSQEELDRMNAHADEASNFWSEELEPKIIEAQMASQLQSKHAELMRELERILAMTDDPAVIIVALTKVNVEKNGLIFTQLGTKLMRYNEQSNKVIEMLKANPSDVGATMDGKQKLSTINLDMQKVQMDMKGIADQISTALTAANTMLGQLNNTKMEIIRKIAVGS